MTETFRQTGRLWPVILSGLKTVLETGSDLGIGARANTSASA